MQPPTSAQAAEAARHEVLSLLNRIIDPCSAATSLPAGLVDMGLIRGLELASLDNGHWSCAVKLCVTHAFCMMTGVFVNEIEKRLEAHGVFDEIKVELDYSTIWTEDLMAPAYRAQLRERRAANGTGSVSS